MDFSGWEKLSLVDYDDNVTTSLFMAGCNMRCPFCQNKDLVIEPQKAPRIPWEAIAAYLVKRKGVLDAVCVSGGEPTLMPDLEEKLHFMKSLGYKIKLDSNGSNPGRLEKLVSDGLVDYIAMDIKNCPGRYGETIGLKDFDLAPIKASVEFLKTNAVGYEFRTTVIEEFHDEAAMREIGEWIKGAKRYRLQLYVDSPNCIKGGFHPVSKKRAEGFCALLTPYVESVGLRSYD